MSQEQHTSGDGLDPWAILQALGVREVTAIRPVRGGSATAIWQVRHGHATSALRVFPAEHAAVQQRELAAMRAAAGGGVPVPRVRAMGLWQDRPALLLSWCRGRTIAAALRAEPWRAWPLGVRFGRTQAAIHAVRAPAQLVDAGSWVEWAGPGTAALQACLRRAGRETDALLHLDYHLLNVMTDGRRITGVLDWANALPGDARADFARTQSILRLDCDPTGRPPLAIRAMLGVFELGWRHGYRQVAGPVRDMAPFHAWAGAVMATDLSAKRDAPFLARVHRWTAAWSERAGCTE